MLNLPLRQHLHKEIRGKVDTPIRLQLLRHTIVGKETDKMFNYSLVMNSLYWDGLRVPRNNIHNGKEVLAPR